MRLTIPKLRTWHLLGIVAASAGFFSVMQFRWSVEDPGYALVRRLRSTDAAARAKAAGELRILHPPERRAIGPLTEALFDSDARVRSNAAGALGWIVRDDDPEAGTVEAALASAIGDRDKAARLAIAEALARFGPKAEVIVPTLIEFARGDDATARGDALFTLCYFARESDQARDVLIGALGDVDHEVRSKAVSGLGQSLFSPGPAPEPFRRTIASALLGAAGDADAFVRSQVVQALGRLGDQTGEEFSRMVEALEDPSADVRYAASCWLGGRRRPNARTAHFLPALGRALSDPDPRVRRAVADALGSGRFVFDADAALPALRAQAQDPDADVRQAVAGAIGAIEKAASNFREHTLPGAITELGDADPAVRVLAANRLEDIGPRAAEAVPSLVRCLADREAEVRRSAARALGQLGPGAAVALPALANLAESDLDEQVRQAATLSRSILLRLEGDAKRSP